MPAAWLREPLILAWVRGSCHWQLRFTMQFVPSSVPHAARCLSGSEMRMFPALTPRHLRYTSGASEMPLPPPPSIGVPFHLTHAFVIINKANAECNLSEHKSLRDERNTLQPPRASFFALLRPPPKPSQADDARPWPCLHVWNV